MEECKPLRDGRGDGDMRRRDDSLSRERDAKRSRGNDGRGLHSFTVHLNVSACCGTGGAFRGRLWGV